MKYVYITILLGILSFLGINHFWGPECARWFLYHRINKMELSLDLVPEPIDISESLDSNTNYYSSITQGIFKVSISGHFKKVIKNNGRINQLSNDNFTFNILRDNSTKESHFGSVLGCSNDFSSFSAIYQATTLKLKEDTTYDSLRRDMLLLNLKIPLLQKATEEYFAKFDTGTFKGFISGDISKSGCLIEIFSPEGVFELIIHCKANNNVLLRDQDTTNIDILKMIKVQEIEK